MKYNAALYEQEIARVQKEHEAKSALRIVLSLIATLSTCFATISLIGILTHSQWVGIPQDTLHSISENLMIFLFSSGTIYLAIFGGIAITAWILRAKI
jgi:hypothetical protein